MKHLIATLACVASIAASAYTSITAKEGFNDFSAAGQVAEIRALSPSAGAVVTVKEVDEWMEYGPITNLVTSTNFVSWTCVWTNTATHALSTNDVTRAPIIPPDFCRIVSLTTNLTVTVATNVLMGVTDRGIVTNTVGSLTCTNHIGTSTPSSSFVHGSGRLLVEGVGNGGSVCIIVK